MESSEKQKTFDTSKQRRWLKLSLINTHSLTESNRADPNQSNNELVIKFTNK